MSLSLLRLARLDKGLTQFLLARETGIPASRLSLMERDQLNPKEKEKQVLARVLGRRVDELFPTEYQDAKYQAQ